MAGISYTTLVTQIRNYTEVDSNVLTADQLENILPELVSGDDPKTVNYNGLVGLLIECVKNQQQQIDGLKDQLNS